jgi:hypothetical protein
MDWFEGCDTDAHAQTEYVTDDPQVLISNASIDDEDMADISDWTDTSSPGAETIQATFDNKSCMKLYTTATANRQSNSYQDVGTFGTRTVVSLNLYCDKIGINGSDQTLQFDLFNGTTDFQAMFASDGLFITDGVSFSEVGTNLVSLDTWQEWTFDIDWTAQTVDVYLNQVLKASDVDCSLASGVANGTVYFHLYGYTITEELVYVDWEKAGNAFPGGSLQSYSEDTDKTQGSYALRVEAATTDSLNKILTHTFAVNSNLAGVKNLRLDARALRTGSNWKLGLHDTGGTTTEITPVIATSNTFQPINWDLSAVADADKDNIDTCKLTVTNADSANTIILDAYEIAQAIDLFGWVN